MWTKIPIDYKNKREHDNLKYYKESVKLKHDKVDDLVQVFPMNRKRDLEYRHSYQSMKFGVTEDSSYRSFQRFDMQTRRKGQ